MITAKDLKQALPNVTGKLSLKGLGASVEVYRDGYGIPHIKAATERDAFFAQGFVTAQDRLWHMDYDRRRGMGRWAEVVGPQALEQDKLMRRFRLEASARADYGAVSERTRKMFDAYAEGVNAFIETQALDNGSLPVEYRIAGISPEPWQPWDGLVAYKVRHILMGVFESKIWRAQAVQKLGPEKAASLIPGYEPGQLVILPPGEAYDGPLGNCLQELQDGAAALSYMTAGGSNSWVVSGSRTASGKPILAGDSHRALDTPNVYYQNHITCPEFDVVGLSFPGVPGFPHFGHNAWVSWCVTHLGADYQDLYVERFKPADVARGGGRDINAPDYYLYKGQWLRAESHRETIKVKGEDDVTITVPVTRHGPVISGSPEQGSGVAFRYTATEGPSDWPDSLWKMLLAKDSDELIESMRQWVDPLQQLRHCRRSRQHRLPEPGQDSGPVYGQCLAARSRLDRRTRMAGGHTLRGVARLGKPGAGLHRHRQQQAGGRRLPPLHLR